MSPVCAGMFSLLPLTVSCWSRRTTSQPAPRSAPSNSSTKLPPPPPPIGSSGLNRIQSKWRPGRSAPGRRARPARSSGWSNVAHRRGPADLVERGAVVGVVRPQVGAVGREPHVVGQRRVGRDAAELVGRLVARRAVVLVDELEVTAGAGDRSCAPRPSCRRLRRSAGPPAGSSRVSGSTVILAVTSHAPVGQVLYDDVPCRRAGLVERPVVDREVQAAARHRRRTRAVRPDHVPAVGVQRVAVELVRPQVRRARSRRR